MTEYPDFPEHFDHSSRPACLLAPVRSPGGKLVDLRFLYGNASLMSHFTHSGLLAGHEDLAAFDLPYFGRILAMSEKVLATGAPQSISIFIETTMELYQCQCLRSTAGNVILVLSGGTYATSDAAKPDDNEFRAFFESGPCKLVLDAATGRILEANRAAVKYYGWTHDELCRMGIYQIDASSPAEVAATLGAVNDRGYLILQVRHRLASGEVRNVEAHSALGAWKDVTAHFAIVLDRSNVDRFVPSVAPGAPVQPITRETIAPFLVRYERDMPDLGDMMMRLVPYCKLVHYRTGEHFLEFGETSPQVGFIVQGLFRQYTITETGTDCTLALYRVGQILDSYAYYRLNMKCLIAFEARNECEVVVVDLQRLSDCSEEDPRWFKLFYYNLSLRLVAKQKRDISLLCDDAAARYRHFLVEDRDALPYLRSYHIASYLGITAETLSRVRRQASTTGPFGRKNRGK